MPRLLLLLLMLLLLLWLLHLRACVRACPVCVCVRACVCARPVCVSVLQCFKAPLQGEVARTSANPAKI